MTRKILVTSALPYANGSIHLGHMVEHIQTDVWVRFQKLRGHECYYCCADDTHGTPVMLAAQKQGIAPEDMIAKVHEEHLADFTGFGIGYDNYYSTHSPENKQFSQDIYRALKANGKIESRVIEQLFDPEKQMFLPDRFVKGECPKCHAQDQYGDNCEVCGTTYSPTELINPYSAVSGAKPELRESEHFFFKLGECADFLKAWTSGNNPHDGKPHLQPEALNKMKEWLGEGEETTLSDWDISRDAPYFGFEIPDAPGKYFYVWLDAPVGYMASFKNLCDRIGIDFDEYFKADSQTEMYHFIGKDILYFHALFWPAMLHFSGHRAPTGVYAHGFLTVDGQKMSKSRGTFITAKSYLEQGLNPEWMRYYIAAKLNSKIEDIDLNLQDFISRVNSDLVGKYVNIAARASGFIAKRFEGRLKDVSGSALLAKLAAESDIIAEQYENREYARSLRDIMALADTVNEYVDANKPWTFANYAKFGFKQLLDKQLSILNQADALFIEEVYSQVGFSKAKNKKIEEFVDALPETAQHLFFNYKKEYSNQNLVIRKAIKETQQKLSVAKLYEMYKKGLSTRKSTNDTFGYKPKDKSKFSGLTQQEFEEGINQDIDNIAEYYINMFSSNDVLHYLCSELINAFTMLTAYLAPVLPQTAANAARFLNLDAITWANTRETLGEHAINKYEHLMQRVEQKQVDDLIEANKQSIAAAAAPAAEESKYEKVAEQASFDDFMKIDMRVAKVLNCEAVEGSTKLLKFDLDFGFEKRIIFSGIAASYPNPAELNGRMVIAVANFAPRKMAKFGVSEGMILSAATAEGKLKLLDVDAGAQPGDKVG
ncbi:methionine--tRNA ligase [Neisseria subflava]|uniref:methionine--tRNA ligase n=2 Tax=Pseudomonadota TaxID=1224 RepID=UPI0027E129B4|nr:methionine--tRNA ligase [Neisseria subflava]